MDKLLEEMIDRGLASIENREILARIPLILAATIFYKPDFIYWIEWLNLNRN